MEKIVVFAKNHWKKLSFALVPLVYGINYVKNDYLTYQHMRNICNIVHEFPTPEDNRVLVVLNPVANKKQCEKMFKNYFEPVLHMAGYDVELVKTKHSGHAKSLMEGLPKLPDVIVVAGGDGTSSEVVTGLMRRNKEMCPILFLPLGEKNETSISLMQNKITRNSEVAKSVSQCMLALIQGRVQHRSVIKYELIEKDNSVTSKPIFGVQQFSWGMIKDIEINKEKYWYFGALKHYISVIIASLSKKFNENISANIISTPPCPGCDKCETFVKNKSRFHISKLLNSYSHTPTQPKHQIKIDKSCSTKEYSKIYAKQVDVTCKQTLELYALLHTQIIEHVPSLSDFLINIMRENNIHPSTILESRTLEVIPFESDHQTYYIDGEGYDARHIKISILPNVLKYFT